MISSLRYDKMSSFRDKFRLLICCSSTISNFSLRRSARRRVFHTFNTAAREYETDRDRLGSSPKELPEIEERLRSRFEWGLIADIQPPDLETKVAILQKKAESEHVILLRCRSIHRIEYPHERARA